MNMKEIGRDIADRFVEEIETWEYPIEVDGVLCANPTDAALHLARYAWAANDGSSTVDPDLLAGFLSKFD